MWPAWAMKKRPLLYWNMADPRIKDNHSRTPINIAREMNHLNILTMLREARRKQKGMAKRTRTLDMLPPKRTDTGTIIQSPVRTDTEVSIETPLAFWALASADLTSEIQTRLLDESCDEINSKDPDMGQTALHFAALNNNVEIARLLISHGADINVFNNWGRTPLHLTVMNNNPEVAGILLDAGADINARSQWIDTPLLYASSLLKSICTLLVERGAGLSDERLPLNQLLEVAVTDGSAIAVRRLVAAGAEVWRKNGYGQTPFMIARYYEHDDIANLLLEVGQSPSATPSADSETTDGGILTGDKGRNDTESTSLVESDRETDTALTGSGDVEDGKIYDAKMASQFLDHAEAEIMKPTQSVKQAPTVVPTALKMNEGNERRIRLLDSTAWITIAILTLIAAAIMIRRS
jgi:ankyrin repeat protein